MMTFIIGGVLGALALVVAVVIVKKKYPNIYDKLKMVGVWITNWFKS